MSVGPGTHTNDIGVDLHLTVSLGQLEGFVVAVGHHQELNGRGVVVKLLEKPATTQHQVFPTFIICLSTT